MPSLTISHRTTYEYRVPVQLLPHRLMLRPREERDLRLLSHRITCQPQASLTWSRDVFGNDVATAQFAAATDSVTIESTAEVELTSSAWPVFAISAAAICYPFRYTDEDWTDLAALAAMQHPDPEGFVQRWARGFIASSSTDTLSLLKDINWGIHTQISYQGRDEQGTQSPRETLSRGWGSCRDLAELMVEAVRALGFGARIVSGYLLPETLATVGAGATHAWAEIYVPGPGWIAFDPTNGTMGGANLIPTTVARGMAQAVPVAGSFVGPDDAFARLEVDVRVQTRPPQSNFQVESGSREGPANG